MKRALVGLCLVLLSSFAWALPSEQQIQDEVKAGRYTQAESMMSDVVSAKPGSAKAHYIYAELLAHNGNFNKAAEETAKARQIDPALTFTDPAKFKSFEETLQREQSAPVRSRAAPTAASSSIEAPATSSMSAGRGIPGWVWIIGLAVVAMILWRGFARSRQASVGAMAPAGFNGGYGPGQVGPGYGPGGAPMGGGGSGMLGTGLAVAGGVAGGMLLDRALRGNEANAATPGGFTGGGDSYAGNPAAQELQDRQVDFGNGNDWDSGGGGGGVDLGGGGDSGGGSWD